MIKRTLAIVLGPDFVIEYVQRWLLIAAATSILCSCRTLELTPPVSESDSSSSTRREPPLPSLGFAASTPNESDTTGTKTAQLAESEVRFLPEQGNSPALAPIVQGANAARVASAPTPKTIWMNKSASDPASLNSQTTTEKTPHGVTPHGVTSSDGDAAVCLEQGVPCANTLATVGLPCPAPSHLHPADEYLCDGGDQNIYVNLTRERQLRGLDLEDTVMHFETPDNKVIVRPSNRVCIYSPRFAAVRHVGGHFEEKLALSLNSANVPVPPQTQSVASPTLLSIERLPIKRKLQILTPTAFKERTPGTEIKLAANINEALEGIAPQIHFEFLQTGVITEDQRALVAEYTAKTTIWTDGNQPQVMIKSQLPAEQVLTSTPEVIYQFDLPGKPTIRLLKVASQGHGRPGEIIEFALRFDNFNGQTVDNVTIIDNLTTRLEYLPDSQVCSRPAEFASKANEGNSQTLSWTLTEPLSAGEGGVIRFKCRIR